MVAEQPNKGRNQIIKNNEEQDFTHDYRGSRLYHSGYYRFQSNTFGSHDWNSVKYRLFVLFTTYQTNRTNSLTNLIRPRTYLAVTGQDTGSADSVS